MCICDPNGAPKRMLSDLSKAEILHRGVKVMVEE